MNDPQHSITTRDVKLWYGKFQALKGINVDIKHGKITSLIGPSGCGKTTLLRCFNRVNERYGNVTTTGEIKLLGKNIYDADVSLIELRKSVGMVFQRPNPLPLSIYENVVFGLRIHADSKPSRSDLDDAVEKALTETGLWADLKDRLHDRAIGLQLEQQQKLCIARLLPLKPRDHPHGRAVLGARRGRHARHRGADVEPRGPLHDRHRHAQHGAGPPREQRDASSCSWANSSSTRAPRIFS